MIDLLIRVKNREIPFDFDSVEGFKEFIESDKNTWSLQEIYNYGSFLFNNMMAHGDKSGQSGYHDWYNMSIQKVAYFVDYRIFSARLGENTLNSVLSPLAIVMTARPFHQRDVDEIKKVEEAEKKLRELGIQVPVQELEPEPEPGPDDDVAAERKGKKSKRKRKSSKKKKKTKRKKKKTKRRKKK